MHQDPDLIAKLPKVELHLHLEGAMRYDTYRTLAGHGPDDPADQWRNPDHRYAGLSGFLATTSTALPPCYRSPKFYERVAYELCQDLIGMGVIHAEVSFGHRVVPEAGLNFDTILDAIARGWERASTAGEISVGFIAAVSRRHGAQYAEDMVNCAIRSQDRGIVGIDLHGDETASDAKEYRRAFEIAGEASLGLRAHAGEGAGVESVWAVVRDLGVQRIAHGVKAVDDNELLDHIRRRGIAVDMCPVSNLKLGLVATLSEHPIRELFNQDLKVTVVALHAQ